MKVTSAEQVEALDFAKGGELLPAIVQHADNGAVLMMGFMNRDALRATFDRRRVVFYSRSKRRLWEKGESSGHTLDLVSIDADCDRDTLLVTARPRGPTCHLGTATCFGDMPGDPGAAREGAVASRPNPGNTAPVSGTGLQSYDFLAQLEHIIERRIADRPEGSYTARLYATGIKRMAQKVGEEAVEVALAAATEDARNLAAEAADLVFHLMVLLRSRGLSLANVLEELQARRSEAARP